MQGKKAWHGAFPVVAVWQGNLGLSVSRRESYPPTRGRRKNIQRCGLCNFRLPSPVLTCHRVPCSCWFRGCKGNTYSLGSFIPSPTPYFPFYIFYCLSGGRVRLTQASTKCTGPTHFTACHIVLWSVTHSCLSQGDVVTFFFSTGHSYLYPSTAGECCSKNSRVLLVTGHHVSWFLLPYVARVWLFPFILCSCVGLGEDQCPGEHLEEAKLCLSHCLVRGRDALVTLYILGSRQKGSPLVSYRPSPHSVSSDNLPSVYPSWKTCVFSWKCPHTFSYLQLWYLWSLNSSIVCNAQRLAKKTVLPFPSTSLEKCGPIWGTSWVLWA